MKNEKIRFSLVMAFLMMLVPSVAFANIVWPSLLILAGMMSWYIILAGLIIEILFIKFIIKENWGKTIIMAVGMNVASAIIGYIAIPLTGFIATLLLGLVDHSTFATSIWVASYILAVLCNVAFEGGFLKIVFKLDFKKNFKWLTIANAISVLLAIATMGFYMDKIDI